MEDLDKKKIINEPEEDDDEDEVVQRLSYEGAYDPNEYLNHNVNNDIKQIFKLITLYTPQIIDIDLKLKPFIPDYIPAVGDIDAFIKVPRPDGVEDNLGLTIIDEPSFKNQSDPTLLNLKLRAQSKSLIQSNESGDENQKPDDHIVKLAENSNDIEQWINSVKSLHESQQFDSSNIINIIAANTKMPDLEQLMQELPESIERLIDSNEILLPDKDLDCELPEFVTIICVLLDIPVHTSKIASLHVLFNLYNEFYNSQNKFYWTKKYYKNKDDSGENYMEFSEETCKKNNEKTNYEKDEQD